MSVWYDGLSPLALPVEVRTSANGIEILRADGAPLAIWRFEQIEIADRRATELTVFLRGGDARLRIDDPAAIAEVLARTQPHLKRNTSRAILRWAVIAVLVLGLGAIGIVFVWPVLADRVAATIPDAWLDPIGQAAARSLVGRDKACAHPEAVAALDRLVTRLSLAADRPKPDVRVISAKSSNAFAVPDNRVMLLGGLIQQAEHPNELAGILAHEMGHLAHRHSARMLVRQLGVFLLVEVLTGGSSLGGFGGTAVALNYSRDFEREADEFALSLMARAGLDARPVAAFFERLAKKEGGYFAQALDYFGTHPASAGRAAAFAASSGGGPAMSQAEFEALKKICE